MKGAIVNAPFDSLGVTPWCHCAVVSAPVLVVLVVSVIAVSMGLTAGAVSAAMPGLPVSLSASPPALRSPHATSAEANMDPRIQDVRFIEMSLHGGAARVPVCVECDRWADRRDLRHPC